MVVLSLFIQQREFLAPNLDSSTRSHVTGSLFADEDADVDRFHAPVFSALEQTRCSVVACYSKHRPVYT